MKSIQFKMFLQEDNINNRLVAATDHATIDTNNMHAKEELETMDMDHTIMLTFACLLCIAILVSVAIPFLVFIISKIIERMKQNRENNQKLQRQKSIRSVKSVKLMSIVERKDKKIKFHHFLKEI